MAAILIVEDEGIVAKDIEMTLRQMNYDVVGIARSGEEAIERATSFRPDLVLMDIHLKGQLDGIATAAILRERMDIPIVYLTAFADDETVGRAKVTEPYGYIVKPFNASELRSVVEVALYKHQIFLRLRENEQGLATTLNSIGDGVIATDELGRVQRMNPAAERLTGWTIEDALGRPIEEVCQFRSEVTHMTIANPAVSALRTGTIVELEDRAMLVSRNGDECPISDRAAPIRDARGQIRGAVLVFDDITTGRKRERELEATKLRLQHLLTANPAIVYTRDATAGAQITFISEDVKTQLGQEPASCVASPEFWKSHIHPDDRATFFDALSQPSSDAVTTCEYRFLHPSGGYRWLHDAFRRVPNSGGEHDEIVGCLVDITNQKYTEFLLARQTRRLERSNKELEEFAYVASHDLRAPLRAISTLAEWIEADLGDVLKGETREQMHLLRGRVQRMDRLLSDLLEYARVGREELAVECVDVRELLAEVIDLSNTTKRFRFEIASSLPCFETAKVPLKRVFLNLLNNAVKHHHRDEGRVTICVDDHGDYFEFSVADDGPGVAAQFHERVFQMFQTLKPRDIVEGSGMGLALVRRIVDDANGKVWLDSQEGQGATFRFTWPKYWTGAPASLSGAFSLDSVRGLPVTTRGG